ncbi:MAG: glycosyltransferase family 87 protein, partial [Terracidiphilus sp.]
GSAVFVMLGAVLERAFPVPMVDFRVLYQPARSLIQHADPYNRDEVLRVSRLDGGDRSSDTEKVRQVVTQYLYPPTSFCLSLPFAMLPWGPARMLWITLTVGGLIFASYLTWILASDYSPVLAGAMAGFLLANSELLVSTGNVAGIVISLCVVAVWCFIRERFVPAGILCLAIGLAAKPHDPGLVWLYFLLAGGVYRKRAWQTLVTAVALSLPAVLWVSLVAPQWMRELHANMLAFSVHGGMNDPGLASTGAHGIGMLVSLQAIFGILWDDPRIYNPASYLTFAPLFLVWAWFTLKSQRSPEKVWLALAAAAALTMLPVYHRQQDTKLLLLTIPACAMLWSEGGLIAWLALLVNSAGFLLTGDIPWAVFLGLIGKLLPLINGFIGKILIGFELFSVPVILLIMGIFYLWVYVRRCSADTRQNAHQGHG